jgi:DNA repair exonuclease SbcCD ATPase subunit|nr:MAG TPA: chromosome partition protein [Caudoviricetes sp.]
MKTITLKKLTLQDWRGQNKVINFGHNTEIKGRNKSGKSSCFNAWLWLLTGADEQDRINYKLFDDTLPLTYENSKLASAEAVLDIDGVEYTLKKTAKQGWTRKKGREEYEKKATDDYKFYIDCIERSAGDYKSFIEETFAPFPKLKLMLNINYFLGMDWRYLRGIFEHLVGEIKDDDFEGDYSIIKNELDKYPPEKIKESIKGQMKPIKQNIESLPITINALQSSLPDISGLDVIREEIEDAKKQIESIDKLILGSNEQAKVYIKKRDAELAEINKLKQEYAEAENKYNTKPIYEANKIKTQIADVDSNNAQIERDNRKNKQVLEDAEKEIKLAKERLRAYEECRKVLLKENENVKSMQFEGEVCSYCGQPLQGEKLEEAKQRFFEQREAKHKSIVATGKSNNEKIVQVKSEIEELQAIIDKGYEEKPLQSKELLVLELDNLRNNFVKYRDTKEGKEKLGIIAYHEANLTDIPSEDTSALQNMKRELLNDIEANSKKLGLKDEYDKQIDKIKEFQSSLRDSASELALLEGKLNAVERYEREKASIISYRVNSKFDYLHVEMTETNKSGNVIDTCKVTDNMGVSASVTNHASKVLIGIDLALALQKFYDINLPLFIDDSELINESNIPSINNQLIKMIVTDEDFVVDIK